MSPVYDFECEECQTVIETIQDFKTEKIQCKICGGTARKIISLSGVNTANNDAEWIRSVREVVEKKSGKPHAEEFLKNPTRANLKNWMDKENLRHMEPGEGERDPEPWRPDERFTDKLIQRHKERNGIIIY